MIWNVNSLIDSWRDDSGTVVHSDTILVLLLGLIFSAEGVQRGSAQYVRRKFSCAALLTFKSHAQVQRIHHNRLFQGSKACCRTHGCVCKLTIPNTPETKLRASQLCVVLTLLMSLGP